MNSSNEQNDPDIEKAKERLAKNRDKILRDASKIEASLASIERAKKVKVSK